MNVDTTNRNGHTALMLAARHGSVECVKLLLDAGANIAAKDKVCCCAVAVFLLCSHLMCVM